MTDNLNLSPSDWTALTDDGAARSAVCPVAAAIPIEMWTLKPDEGRDAHRQPAHVHDVERARLQRRSTFRRWRASRRSGLRARRRHDREARARRRATLRDNPNSLAILRAGDAVPDACSRLSGSYRLPWEFQVSAQLYRAARRQHLGQLHGHQRNCRPPDHRQHGRHGADHASI